MNARRSDGWTPDFGQRISFSLDFFFAHARPSELAPILGIPHPLPNNELKGVVHL